MSKSRTTSDSSDSLLGPCTLHRKQSRGFQPYAFVIKKKKALSALSGKLGVLLCAFSKHRVLMFADGIFTRQEIRKLET